MSGLLSLGQVLSG